MNLIEKLLSSEVVQALGWTILHSLWQGFLVALILGVLMLLLHKHSSTVRYFVSVTALVTVLLLSAVTFFGLYDSLRQPLPKGDVSVKYKIIPNIGEGHTYYQVPEEGGFWTSLTSFIDYFNTHLPLIVTIWLVGVAVLALRLLGGLAYAQRLKSYRTKMLGEVWQAKLKKMANHLRIKQEIELLESCFVKVPMVIGHIKPVILLPVGAVTGLSVEQVEAILAHELAHISRNDYLVNIFQSVVDLVFFYHPGVWWISANIRSERENCCDDIAVSLSDDRLAVAKALTNLQTITWSTPNMAMAATGQSGKLFNRVKRLVEAKSTNPTFKEGFIAACVLMVSILSLSFNASSNYESNPEEPTQVWIEKEMPFLATTVTSESEVAEVEEVEIPKAIAPEIVEKENKSATTVASSKAEVVNGEIGVATAILPAPVGIASKMAYPIMVGSDTTQNKYWYRANQTLSTTLENGKYAFIRYDEKGEIAEMFVEGKKVSKKKYAEYEPMLKKNVWANDFQRAQHERERAVVNALREAKRETARAQMETERAVNRAMREVERETVRAKVEWSEHEEEWQEAMAESREAMAEGREAWHEAMEELREMNIELSDSMNVNFVMPVIPNFVFADSGVVWNGVALGIDAALQSLEALEGLEGLEGLEALEGLESLAALSELEGLEELEELGGGANYKRWSYEGMQKSLLDALRSDGFEPKSNGEYKFDIDGERLLVNGKRQSDELYKKYKKILEKETGSLLDDGTHYILTIDED